MIRNTTILFALLLATAGCGDGDDDDHVHDDGGHQDSAADASDEDSAPADTPSTDPATPVVLTPGQTFTATIAADGTHFFSLTPVGVERYTVTFDGGPNMQVNWCDDSVVTGCLCAIAGNFSTCCQTMTGSTCTYTLEKSEGVGFDAGVTIYPQVYALGAGATYTLTISAPL